MAKERDQILAVCQQLIVPAVFAPRSTSLRKSPQTALSTVLNNQPVAVGMERESTLPTTRYRWHSSCGCSSIHKRFRITSHMPSMLASVTLEMAVPPPIPSPSLCYSSKLTGIQTPTPTSGGMASLLSCGPWATRESSGLL